VCFTAPNCPASNAIELLSFLDWSDSAESIEVSAVLNATQQHLAKRAFEGILYLRGKDENPGMPAEVAPAVKSRAALREKHTSLSCTNTNSLETV
jgi:hypothetical protein